ncbi:MAG: glycosyltransferase family 39 protein [Deltaproteobacteria bacterium]|nr:glycosyltransferase family 39 protein [Deltaproteobacteria bacterium]
MISRFVNALAIIWTVIGVTSEAGAQPAPGPRPVITTGHEAYFRSLLGKFAHGIGGHRFEGAKIDSERVVYSFRKDPGSFEMVLEHPSNSLVTRHRSPHFAISFEFAGVGQPAREAIAAALAREVAANDIRDVWDRAGEADSPGAAPGRGAGGPAGLVLLLVFGALVALGLSGRVRVPMLGAIESLHAAVERLSFPLTLCVAFTAAFLRFQNADMPLFEGGAIERLFIASQNPLRNLVNSYDPRHPGLYFAIVHFPLKLSGYSVWPVQCIGLVFSLVSVLLAGAVARRYAGALGAILAMALLAVSPEHIQRSREVTDLSLFVMLALAAVFFYQRSLDTGGRTDKILFSLSLGLSLLSSFAALLVGAAIALHALWNPARRRALLIPLAAAFAIGLPVLVRIFASVPAELQAKGRAGEYAGVFWGAWGPVEFAGMTARALFTNHEWILVVFVIALTMIVGRKDLKTRGPLGLILLLNLAFVGGSALFRMKPYYAIFLQVAAFVLAASLADAPPGREFASFEAYARRFVPVCAALVLYTAYGLDLRDRWEPIYIQSSNFEEDVRTPVQAALAEGAMNIVIDISHDKGPVAYHFFKKPFESMRNHYVREGAAKPCAPADGLAFVCEDAGSERRIYALTEGADPGPRWQERAVEKLKTLLSAGPLHFTYSKQYPNEPMRLFLESSCERRSENKKYELYRCGMATDD